MALSTGYSAYVVQAGAGDAWDTTTNSTGPPDGLADSVTPSTGSTAALRIRLTSGDVVPSDATITGVKVIVRASIDI